MSTSLVPLTTLLPKTSGKLNSFQLPKLFSPKNLTPSSRNAILLAWALQFSMLSTRIWISPMRSTQMSSKNGNHLELCSEKKLPLTQHTLQFKPLEEWNISVQFTMPFSTQIKWSNLMQAQWKVWTSPKHGSQRATASILHMLKSNFKEKLMQLWFPKPWSKMLFS